MGDSKGDVNERITRESRFAARYRRYEHAMSAYQGVENWFTKDWMIEQ